MTVKYARNNHAPGGFVRLTLVPLTDIMNKAAHARNAFHYSCWGAHPVAAKGNDLERDRHGFSLVGSDGRDGKHQPGYYVERVTVPPVVPDGDYVLGWAWYGGIGGPVHDNDPQEPRDKSYFGDYWSCSFVRVRGGDRLKKRFTPVFVNGMNQFSSNGCMSFADRPGICVYEPCKGIRGTYQKPIEFKDGKTPRDLTPVNFKPVTGIIDKKEGENDLGINDTIIETEKMEKSKSGNWKNKNKMSDGNDNIMKTKKKMMDHSIEDLLKPARAKKESDLMTNSLAQKNPRMRTGWGKDGHRQSKTSSPVSTISSKTRNPSLMEKYLSCLCIKQGVRCKMSDVINTKCQPNIPRYKQPDDCLLECCEYCRRKNHSDLCKALDIEGGCDANS